MFEARQLQIYKSHPGLTFKGSAQSDMIILSTSFVFTKGYGYCDPIRCKTLPVEELEAVSAKLAPALPYYRCPDDRCCCRFLVD